MGLKAPDETTIPLCQFHHREYHRLGVKTWEEMYGSHEEHLEKTLARLRMAGLLSRP